MYLWRKIAEQHWLNAQETRLQERALNRLAVITKPACKRLQLEIACKSRTQARRFLRDFGGRIEKLPHDWWKRLEREHDSKPLKIGKRLYVFRASEKREAGSFPDSLVIPAGAAFGTGDHVTTAMSLRLLEEVTSRWRPGWLMADLGTGSGIIALAARRFSARRVLAIDLDPIAISTAKANARLNEIDKIDFRLSDLRAWKPARKFDIVTANLFSELLTDILPRLKRSNWLILSGVLRAQEKELVRALRRNKIAIAQMRRRGKWIAVLARGRACVQLAN